MLVAPMATRSEAGPEADPEGGVRKTIWVDE